MYGGAADKETSLAEREPWYTEIRAIHDRHFDDPWQERADEINRKYGLSGNDRLVAPIPGYPIPWFNGDIEQLEPERWALVVSLNHQIDPEKTEVREDARDHGTTPDTYWNHWRRVNSTHFYRDFFGPLARVAAGGFGEQLTRDQESAFATERMIFVEICPYGSHQFRLPRTVIAELLAEDLGFQLAARVNHILMERGHPAFVLVNGGGALATFEILYGDQLSWRMIRYDSATIPREGAKRKRLWHRYGWLQIRDRRVPIIGFPFLRTRMTHNSNPELQQLANHIRFFLTRGQQAASPDPMSHQSVVADADVR